LAVTVRGEAQGTLRVYLDTMESAPVSEAAVHLESDEWKKISFELSSVSGVHALYFMYEGDGALQVKEILF
jgi:hypothetical protein